MARIINIKTPSYPVELTLLQLLCGCPHISPTIYNTCILYPCHIKLNNDHPLNKHASCKLMGLKAMEYACWLLKARESMSSKRVWKLI